MSGTRPKNDNKSKTSSLQESVVTMAQQESRNDKFWKGLGEVIMKTGLAEFRIPEFCFAIITEFTERLI